MKIYAPDADFIDLLLRRPQMYMLGNTFEGVINLMFGIRIATEHHTQDDQLVLRWRAFEEWMYERHLDSHTGLGWGSFRERYPNDKEATAALQEAYAEFSEIHPRA